MDLEFPRGGEVESHWAHNPENVGAIPTFATSPITRIISEKNPRFKVLRRPRLTNGNHGLGHINLLYCD